MRLNRLSLSSRNLLAGKGALPQDPPCLALVAVVPEKWAAGVPRPFPLLAQNMKSI